MYSPGWFGSDIDSLSALSLGPSLPHVAPWASSRGDSCFTASFSSSTLAADRFQTPPAQIGAAHMNFYAQNQTPFQRDQPPHLIHATPSFLPASSPFSSTRQTIPMDGFFRDLVGDSDEEAHAWLTDFKKYITIQTLNVAAGRQGEVRATAFGAHIARGSEAHAWYNTLTPAQKESWTNLLMQFDIKWTPPPFEQRTAESYLDEFRTCVLPAHEVLTRFPTGSYGQTQWGYVLYASRMRTLGEKTQQSLAALLLDIKKLIPPILLWLMRTTVAATWKDWCTALGALKPDEIQFVMGHTSEIEDRLAKLEAAIQAQAAAPAPAPPPPPPPQPVQRQTWQPRQAAPAQAYYQPAYMQYAPAPAQYVPVPAPTPPIFVQYAQPGPARPAPPVQAGPPPQLSLQAPQTPNPFYSAPPPRSPQNTQRVDEERRAWTQQFPDGRPLASRPYPLTPGTAPAALGCIRCGEPETGTHDQFSCTNPLLDSLEQRCRINVRSAIHRGGRPQSATVPRGSAPFSPSPLGQGRGIPAFGRWSAPSTPTPPSPLHYVNSDNIADVQYIDRELDVDYSMEPQDDETLNGGEVS
ncbi:hypothetical protein AURDEDRAFT_130121 [Auricularia subglabra TFB-10046 SS5]|uniref:Uncharacterized protein n=1 Tax=Auricularia subglabra (strain TFB-10046 / SS5) TaxID=717982 RepID=J0WST7_AURST|nr:hypothetical protein AURDEDRAFT_130121 [Auricularia subglabra TFB-10046 SS5]